MSRKGNGAAPPVLPRGDLHIEEMKNVRYRASLPRDVTLENVTESSIWSVIAEQLRPYDRIAAVAHDESFWCELLVRSAINGRVAIVMLNSVELPAGIEDTTDNWPPGYTLSRNEKEGWVITRDKDNVVMGSTKRHGFQTKEQARRYLKDHATLRR
jgi:hypothetical protein